MDLKSPRPWFALAVVACLATSGPKVAAQQPQPPALAGATRPNLQVLKVLPEPQLFLLMNLVSDSLGVRCDYCHVQDKPDFGKTPSNVGGWNFASDDKPQKQKAREMMRMVVDLNAKNFQGGPRVTCFTCHRGTTDPARLPPIPSLGTGATTPARPALPSVDRVWTNYVSAVGPVGSTARGIGTIMSGWDDRPEGRYGKLEIVVAGTDRYRVTLTTPTGTISQGIDGDVAWAATNDRGQRLAGDDVARMRRIGMRYRPIKERPANLQIAGVTAIAGHDAFVASAKVDAVTTLTMYFDAVTGLLRRELTTTETLLLPLVEQVDYDDYRSVNGVMMPFRIDTSDGAPYDLVTRMFLDIRRNVAVDDALFRPPGGG
jgi:hypothetical protein